MITKSGKCSGCNQIRPISNKKHMMCFKCNQYRRSKEKRKVNKIKDKDYSLIDLYKEIWYERGMKCYFTGKPLNYEIGTSLWRSCFMHVLAKGQNKYPLFKLYKANIILVDPSIHHEYDHGTEDKLRVLLGDKLEELYSIKDKLKNEYLKLKN